MDIAREAYGKAEALESRGFPSASGETFSDLGAGGELADVKAGTLVCVTATLTGTGSARVLFGGAEMARLTVPGTSTAAFAAAEDGCVSVEAENAEFVRVILSAFGGATVRAFSPVRLRADESDGEIYALIAGEYTDVYKAAGGTFSPVARLGACDDADICAHGPAVVYASGGRAYAALIGSGKGSVCLGRGRLVSVCRDGEGYLAAVWDGTKVTVIELSDSMIPVRSASCHGSPTVDGLAFAKGGETASLVVSDSGRNILRRVSRGGDALAMYSFAIKEEE